MTYTYTWTNNEKTGLRRKDEDGTEIYISAYPGNSSYAEFLASGATAAPYVAPPAPPEPTPEEKLARSGLTVDELKELLGLDS